MTRGKHGAAAAVRQEVQTAAQQIETYKQAVVRLTRERDESRQALRDRDESARATERKLRSQVEYAASPKITALELLLKQRTEERDGAVRRHRDLSDSWQKVLGRIHAHFRNQHGMDGRRATEAMAAIVIPGYEDDDPIVYDDGSETAFAQRYGPAAVEAIRRARPSARVSL